MENTQEKIPVTNPYPEWQSGAGDTNCWNCFKLLWHRADTLKHLCGDCQQTHVAVEDRVVADCVLTGAAHEDPSDCDTHRHELERRTVEV